MSALMAKLHKEKNILVVNASRNGDTTRLALERMPGEVQAYGLDILFVQFGINDCNHWETDSGCPRVSPEAFEANLREIIARGRFFGAKTVLINTNHPTLKKIDFMEKLHQENNAAYNEICRNVAIKDNSIILIDTEALFLKTLSADFLLTDLLLPDGIHLSESGHDLYLKSVWPALSDSVTNIVK
jgi:lysophospholipase L1-like esterase